MSRREYQPVFLLESFIKKSSSNYRFWIVEDLMVIALIFLKIFGENIGINFFSDGASLYQKIGRYLIVSSFLIWQLWGVYRCQTIRSFANKLLRESVVLDSWREVRKIRKFLFIGMLFTFLNMCLTVGIISFKLIDEFHKFKII